MKTKYINVIDKINEILVTEGNCKKDELTNQVNLIITNPENYAVIMQILILEKMYKEKYREN